MGKVEKLQYQNSAAERKPFYQFGPLPRPINLACDRLLRKVKGCRTQETRVSKNKKGADVLWLAYPLGLFAY